MLTSLSGSSAPRYVPTTASRSAAESVIRASAALGLPAPSCATPATPSARTKPIAIPTTHFTLTCTSIPGQALGLCLEAQSYSSQVQPEPLELGSHRTSILLCHVSHRRTGASSTSRTGTARSPAYPSNPPPAHSHPPTRSALPRETVHSAEP